MKVRQTKLLLGSTSTNTSTCTSQSTSTPENASLVRTLFDLFFLLFNFISWLVLALRFVNFFSYKISKFMKNLLF